MGAPAGCRPWSVTDLRNRPVQEVWQPIPGWEGFYEVSDQGRVRSLPDRLRKCLIGAQGYPAVDLKHAGKRKTYTVHTLVLLAFVGPRPAAFECRHLNGIRTDNRLCNLAWGTPKENDQDRRRHGTFIEGERHGASKLTEQDIRLIRAADASQASIARRFKVSQSLISMIKSRQRWAHVQ